MPTYAVLKDPNSFIIDFCNGYFEHDHAAVVEEYEVTLHDFQLDICLRE
jgi:hypothetical protein